MPWRRGADTADTFVRPAAPPRVPNIAHWAWRDGDADWTLALSVAMAAVVQRPEALYLHTGPLAAGATAYTEPQTPAGRAALRCLRAAGAQEVRHAADPAPGGGRHPWAEVLGRGRRVRSKQTFAHLSDVTRLKTILDMGGIYLDRDAFLRQHATMLERMFPAILGASPDLPLRLFTAAAWRESSCALVDLVDCMLAAVRLNIHVLHGSESDERHTEPQDDGSNVPEVLGQQCGDRRDHHRLEHAVLRYERVDARPLPLRGGAGWRQFS